jgi:hypothetical protein
LIAFLVQNKDAIQVVLSFLAVIGLAMTFLSLQRGAQQRQLSALSSVQDRWNAIYEARNALIGLDLKAPEVWGLLNSDLSDDARRDKIMRSEVWLKTVRPVANFYEFIGMMVHEGYISARVLLVLVTVDDSSWEKAQPFIAALTKTGYRPDLYVFWRYLIERRRGTPALLPIKPTRWSKFRHRISRIFRI